MDPMPVITLKNGLRVGNFSSPHPFNFTTGEELPACTTERARASALESVEIETPVEINGVRTVALDLEWKLPALIFGMLEEAQENRNVDIVLVPFPVIEALRLHFPMYRRILNKIRCIRCADRITKAIHSDRFCW